MSSAPRDVATKALVGVIELPGFLMAHKSAILDALRFWVEQPALDFADCYHLALAKSLGFDAIYTFDRKMDRYPGVERVEP
jgi:predicted nucleic acid-binding protein